MSPTTLNQPVCLLSQLQSFISVEAPYNVLTQIENYNDGLSAIVTNEFLNKYEGGPIACGEFGRHLAILGSLVLANTRTDSCKHYYLATNAKIERVYEDTCIKDVITNDDFCFYARPILNEKRLGGIKGYVTDEKGKVVFSGEVYYQIIPYNTFEKLFRKRRLDTSAVDSSIFKRKTIKKFIHNDLSVTANYGEVSKEHCSGHFKNYPALPVAIIANLFMELGIELCKKHKLGSNEKFIVKGAQIEAVRLVFATEKVQFKAIFKKPFFTSEPTVLFHAFVDDEVVAKGIAQIIAL